MIADSASNCHVYVGYVYVISVTFLLYEQFLGCIAVLCM